MRRHKRKALPVVVALLVLPVFVQAAGGNGHLFVSANAPQMGESLSVLIAADPGVYGACDGLAEAEVERDGTIVYPRLLNQAPMQGCRGTIDIPYSKFVDTNGIFVVRAFFDGKVAETPVMVTKFVEWVYIRAFNEPENDRVRVDAAFDTVANQPLTSSVFATGELVLDVRWESCSSGDQLGLPIPIISEPCQAERDLVFHAEIPVQDRASTHVFVPYSSLQSPKFDNGQAEGGWYNVTATFHNDQAKSNYNVPMDPSVFNEDPPGNWFQVVRE